MADSFLRRWFGGSRAAALLLDEARADLDQLATARPALAAPLRWLRDLLPDLVPDAAPPASPSLTAEQARAKFASGIPLLRGEPLAIDKTFRRRWQRVCDGLQSQQPDGAGSAIAEALRRGRLDAVEMAAAVVAGRPEAVREQAEALGLDPGLTTTVLRFSLFPLFTSLESSLASLHAGTSWGQGYCPTCGSWPLLGEFRGLDQSGFLRCGLCAASWEVPRLWCPFCGNHDHEGLRFLHAEGEETKYRALVCEACRGYVKMLTTLSALPPLPLLPTRQHVREWLQVKPTIWIRSTQPT